MKKKQYKIVIVAFGHVDVTIPLVETLNEQKHVADLILCFAQNKKAESILNFRGFDLPNGFQKKEILEKILIENNINDISQSKKYKLFIYYNLKFRSLKNFFLSWKLAMVLKKYDIIHFTGEDGVLPQLIFILRLFNKKMIFNIHDFYPHSGENTSLFNKLFRKYLVQSKYNIVIHNKCDFNKIVNENPSKRNKINYIPIGSIELYKGFCGTSNMELNELQSDILFFGRIAAYKGIQYLVKATEIVMSSIPNIKVTIAGSGDYDFDISLYTNHPNFSIINTFLSNGVLADLIANTKIVVCPYTDATQSGVALTAFAFNKPIIASNVGGFVDVIKHGVNGLLVPPKDSEKIAEAILYLLNNDNLLEEMKQNIIDLKTNGENAWEKISEKYIKLYNHLTK